MVTDWEEFDGGEYREQKLRMRVTLNASFNLYFGVNAFQVLGRPEAVKLFFDAADSRIGVKAVPPGPKTFRLVRATGEGDYFNARAYTFCKHYGIKPEATIEFQNVEISADGFMVLDLKTARRLRR